MDPSMQYDPAPHVWQDGKDPGPEFVVLICDEYVPAGHFKGAKDPSVQ
jgi:hypothetical protein